MNENYQNLTERQREVLRHFALGLTVKETAQVMQATLKAVESHRYRILKTLQAQNLTELCLKAIEAGVITIAELPVVSTVPPNSLVPQEQQMIPLLARGQTINDIAAQLHRTRKTVEGRWYRIMARLGLTSRVQLLHYALQQKLIEVQVRGATTSVINTTCPDCRGSGRYVGLRDVETCRLCQGHGSVSRAG